MQPRVEKLRAKIPRRPHVFTSSGSEDRTENAPAFLPMNSRQGMINHIGFGGIEESRVYLPMTAPEKEFELQLQPEPNASFELLAQREGRIGLVQNHLTAMVKRGSYPAPQPIFAIFDLEKTFIEAADRLVERATDERRTSGRYRCPPKIRLSRRGGVADGIGPAVQLGVNVSHVPLEDEAIHDAGLGVFGRARKRFQCVGRQCVIGVQKQQPIAAARRGASVTRRGKASVFAANISQVVEKFAANLGGIVRASVIHHNQFVGAAVTEPKRSEWLAGAILPRCRPV